MTLVVAWIGDRYHIRGPLLVVNATLGLIGLPILVSYGVSPHPGKLLTLYRVG